jgi:ribonuclease Z
MTEPSASPRLRVHVLGSGSSAPSPDRVNSSYLLDHGGNLALVDCSGSPAHEVLKRGLDLAALRHVYLTHGHVDHVYALPSLIHSLWLLGLFRATALTITGSAETLGIARQLLAAFQLEDRKNAVSIAWTELPAEASRPVDGPAGLEVTAFPVTHADLEAFGFRFAATLFTGDAIVDGNLETALHGVENLVVDCGGGITGSPGHAGVSELSVVLRQYPQLKRVLLTHTRGLDADLSRIEEHFHEFQGDVRILSDGDQIDF